MRIIRKSCKIFRAEWPYCYAYLEYDRQEAEIDVLQCPCCGGKFSHTKFGEPVRESEDTE
jgi:hypothetical protein